MMKDIERLKEMLVTAGIPFRMEEDHRTVIVRNDDLNKSVECDECPVPAWPGLDVVFHFAPSGRLLSVYATE